jgi:hypothetical protein
MVLGSFLSGRRRVAHEKCVRGFVSAMNGKSSAKIDNFLTSDIEFRDLGGASVIGIDAFFENSGKFRKASGSPHLEIDTLDHNGDEILLRGHLLGGVPEVNGPTMWHIFFRDRMICRVEVARADGQLTMPRFAARYSAQHA